jgi:uncharacterized protein (TIGR00369 family)
MTDTPQILPWTRSCFVCGEDNPHGLHLRSRLEAGRVVIDYTTRPADLGYRHIVHGGIAITLLDEVMTWAAIVAAHRACVAAEINVRLRRPIQVGQRLRVAGRVVKSTARLLLTEGEICGPAGELFMAATGKYMPMPPDQAALTEKDFIASPESVQPAQILDATGSV